MGGRVQQFILCSIHFFSFKIFFYPFSFLFKDGVRTPLDIAAQNGNKGTVEILLEKGANLNLADEVYI